MNKKINVVLIFVFTLLAGTAILVQMTQAGVTTAGSAPTVVAYQGEVTISGSPYTGEGYFKFAIVNDTGTTTYWSNDSTSTGGGEPTSAVQLTVSSGLFSVLLGDTTLGGMTQALTAGVFSQPDRYLRVWFSDNGSSFNQLSPDTRIAAVPYALQAMEAAEAANADTLDNFHAFQLMTHYENVVMVAKSGGDYANIQIAIDSIVDAAADNPYLVWVGPGEYQEQVTMKPFIHLQGAGQDVTLITSTIGNASWPPTKATLKLSEYTSLRDLTLVNFGISDSNIALLATEGMTQVFIENVTSKALGSGVSNFAICLNGSGTFANLQKVIALAANGSSHNIGLFNFGGATTNLSNSSLMGSGGSHGWGIFNSQSDSRMEIDNVSALGESGTTYNSGMYNYDGAEATLRGGSYTGRGGGQTGGVSNALNATLTAIDVSVLAENGSENYGFGNYNVSTATLNNGNITARGGENNYAVSNELTATLKARDVTSLAENGSGNNYGVWNVNNAVLELNSASVTGRGGANAYGINSQASGTTLETEGVIARGENASSENHGMKNSDTSKATLSGGSFIGRGGTYAYGITNTDPGSELSASGVTALCENGSSNTFGINNSNGGSVGLLGGSFTARGGSDTRGVANNHGATLFAANVTTLAENGGSFSIGLVNYGTAVLRGGSFTGMGGGATRGIYNSNSSVTLTAERITAKGTGGSSTNYGIYNHGNASFSANSSQFIGTSYGLYLINSTAQLGSTQLDGGVNNPHSGTLTCVQVYDGNFAEYTCP